MYLPARVAANIMIPQSCDALSDVVEHFENVIGAASCQSHSISAEVAVHKAMVFLHIHSTNPLPCCARSQWQCCCVQKLAKK
jgi:hypothetical protein